MVDKKVLFEKGSLVTLGIIFLSAAETQLDAGNYALAAGLGAVGIALIIAAIAIEG